MEIYSIEEVKIANEEYKGGAKMTVKELEDILRNYDKELYVSFNKYDTVTDSFITDCDVSISKNTYTQILEIVI